MYQVEVNSDKGFPHLYNNGRAPDVLDKRYEGVIPIIVEEVSMLPLVSAESIPSSGQGLETPLQNKLGRGLCDAVGAMHVRQDWKTNEERLLVNLRR